MSDTKKQPDDGKFFYTLSCNSTDCIHRVGIKCKFPVMRVDNNGECVAYKRKEKNPEKSDNFA